MICRNFFENVITLLLMKKTIIMTISFNSFIILCNLAWNSAEQHLVLCHKKMKTRLMLLSYEQIWLGMNAFWLHCKCVGVSVYHSLMYIIPPCLIVLHCSPQKAHHGVSLLHWVTYFFFTTNTVYLFWLQLVFTVLLLQKDKPHQMYIKNIPAVSKLYCLLELHLFTTTASGGFHISESFECETVCVDITLLVWVFTFELGAMRK